MFVFLGRSLRNDEETGRRRSLLKRTYGYIVIEVGTAVCTTKVRPRAGPVFFWRFHGSAAGSVGGGRYRRRKKNSLTWGGKISSCKSFRRTFCRRGGAGKRYCVADGLRAEAKVGIGAGQPRAGLFCNFFFVKAHIRIEASSRLKVFLDLGRGFALLEKHPPTQGGGVKRVHVWDSAHVQGVDPTLAVLAIGKGPVI